MRSHAEIERCDHPRPIPLTDVDRQRWASHERANRKAAHEYLLRRDRAAFPGCAAGCERVVWGEGVTCWMCRPVVPR